MVATSIKPQPISARADSDDRGDWGTPQIVTPAVVGGVLLLLFASYIIWHRRFHDKHSYGYHQVRSDWVSKIDRIFGPQRRRQKVLHTSIPITLDNSMRTSVFTFDFSRRSRQYRSDSSDSSDSQTPLTSTSYTFDFPSYKFPDNLSDSPPPFPKRRSVRWWWLFSSRRPQQVKSEEPGQRWRIDDPDGTSSHGHHSHGHRYTAALTPLQEDAEDGEDEVIRIGDNFTSAASTPVTQHFPEQARIIHGLPTVPEQPSSSGTRTPVPAVSVPQNNTGTPVSVNRSLPPSYDVSQSHPRYTSTEETTHLTLADVYMTFPPPVRAAGYPSPRIFHGRELSSFLTIQPPMLAASTY